MTILFLPALSSSLARLYRRPRARLRGMLLLPLLVLIAACSPKYNWRDYTAADASYRVLFPAKPSSTTREIDLDGMKVRMTMAAAEVDGATFAVGAAEAPDAARAQAALEAMKLALLRNIGADGAATSASASASSSAGDGKRDTRASSDIDATGTSRGRPMRLVGHFEARGKRFFQVIVVGPAPALPPEQVEQFLTSFSVL
ncbi:hypothetical protein [Massilia forsythiae]|nr:hypothetical protein [Massilia forsythiae]